MKPPAFDYHRPTSIEQAVELMAEFGHHGKALAGGQSLVPLLNFRLADPETLIDLNQIGALTGVRRSGSALRIGAMTRQTAIERSALVAANWPLLTEAVRFVAHPQIRNRGTVGGSVAHADPAAELPVALTALDARVSVRSKRGERTIEIADLFVTHLTTTLEDDEILVEIEVDPLPSRTGHAFIEFARRHGDFALGGAAALITLDEDGACRGAAIALLGVAPIPVRAVETEHMLVGSRITESAVRAAADVAVADISSTGDIHGTARYRRALCAVMVRRAVVLAARRASEVNGMAQREPA